ncbi:MAG: hypothetical protein C0592_09180 [Marinilabiliales bacterium]|nr:MAG: hypothetical protein C0592_09180 [Marinilabiliales bacterium]
MIWTIIIKSYTKVIKKTETKKFFGICKQIDYMGKIHIQALINFYKIQIVQNTKEKLTKKDNISN